MTPPIEQRLLSSARRIFAQRGYARATVRHIVADAHAAPNSVYRCFGGKQGLFQEALFTSINNLLHPARSLLYIPVGTNGTAFSSALVHALHQWYAALPRDAACLLMQTSLSDDVSVKHAAASVLLTTVQILAARLQLEQNLRRLSGRFSAAESAKTIIHTLFQYKSGNLFENREQFINGSRPLSPNNAILPPLPAAPFKVNAENAP